MSDPKEEDLLQPLSLDPGPTPERKRRPSRMVWGGLLALGLMGWAFGLFRLFHSQEPNVSSDTPPAQMDAPEEEVSVTPTSTPSTEQPEPPLPTPEKRMFTLRSTPSGASVLFDGRFLGTTPLEMEEWESGQQMQLRKAGYLPVRAALPENRDVNEMTVDLSAETATVRLRGELDGAVIRAGGETVRLEEDGLLALPLKETLIQIQKEGFEPWERPVTPAKSYQREIVVVLKKTSSPSQTSLPGKIPEEDGPVVTNSLGMDMVRVQVPVEVEIGAALGTPGRKSHEGIRSIRLKRPFRLGSTEVTNAQFSKFDPSHSSGTSGSLNLSASDLPVVNLTWEQAAQFCNWLSEQEGLSPAYLKQEGKWTFDPNPGTGYRLPTEAEWEGVLRQKAGKELYAWGDSLPPPSGTINVAGEESKSLVRNTLSKYKDESRGPAPASKAFEEPKGFRGLAGNVREWVHDGFSAPTPGQTRQVDPMEDSAARFHVIKGASWMDGLWMDLRVARRRYDEAGAVDLGFRVARYLSE